MKDCSIIDLLEKHWLGLTIADREVLFNDLGVIDESRDFLDCKTIKEVIRSDYSELPYEVRGRLLMAVTDKGFSKAEYGRAILVTRRGFSREEYRFEEKGHERQ